MAICKKENQLNEKDSLQDMLLLEKSLAKIYVTALTEASGKSVRSTLKNGLTSTLNTQFSVYKTMNECGYYEPAPADKAVIDTKKETFEKVLNTLKQAK